MIKLIKENKIPIILALVHFFVSIIFKIDNAIYNYPDTNYTNMIIIKILYCILLFFFWGFNYHVYKKIKGNNKAYKRGFKLFLIYFAIMIILLLLTWPGLWSLDDIWEFQDVSYMYFGAWQHFLTSLSYTVFLQFLPFAAGIIIIRNYIISLCVAFIITKIENSYNLYLKNKFLDYTLKLLPFLLFPILRYQLSGYRMGLYVYIELTMFCMIFFAIKNKEKWSYSSLILFSFLCTLTSVWRTESLFYCVIISFILLFIKNIGDIKKRIIGFLLILICSILLNSYQNILLKNDNYKIMSTIRQAAVLVRNANPATEKEHIENLDKIINTKEILDNPQTNGEVLYWDKKIVKNEYTKEEYNTYLKSFLNLAFAHFDILFAERFSLFMQTNNIYSFNGQEHIINVTSKNYEKNSDPIYSNIIKKFKLDETHSPKTKIFITKIMCLKDNFILYWCIWNLNLPLTALFIFSIYLIKHKKWLKLSLMSTILIKFFLIIATAPSPWFMYYLTFYLIGYVIIFYSFINHLCKKRKIKNA